jgi:hypothetical protein
MLIEEGTCVVRGEIVSATFIFDYNERKLVVAEYSDGTRNNRVFQLDTWELRVVDNWFFGASYLPQEFYNFSA